MKINNAFDIGQPVYLKTDPDQFERIVTKLTVTQNNILYEVAFVERETTHYEFELSTERNEVKRLTE